MPHLRIPVTIFIKSTSLFCISCFFTAGPIGGGYDYEFGWTETITSYAFSGCIYLTSVTIPDSVTSIDKKAFFGCTSLSSINIPEGVTSIGMDAFSGCGFSAAGPIGGGYDYEFGWTDAIPKYAFYNCTNISNITIPKGVISIRSSAFEDCTSLSSVNIPEGATSIGAYTFYNCCFSTAGPIGGNYDYEFGWTEAIPVHAFSHCTSLSSVIIPKGVTSINYNAFSYCTSLSIITLPEGVTSIGMSAFYSCTGLTSINIPDSVTRIDISAFHNCTSLTSIIIPDSVTSISSSAFSNSGLTEVYCYEGSAADDKSLYPDGVTIIYLDGSSDDSDLEFTDLTDAVRILRYAEGSVSLTEAELAAADINSDEAVDEKDAALVLKQLMSAGS